MSNKSGQVISLPKGGGALQGLGEKFSPDLHTGTGNFSVPIALPSGRNGFQPELSLLYSTGNGNGPFGLGWSLSIPGVTRQTSKGVPIYDDSEDTFVLSGAEDLVPVERLAGKTRYRPRTEGLFARIDHHRDATDNYWEVRSKDGLLSLYGTPASAGSDSAAVADPQNRTKIFAWKLSATVDTFGNRIEYEYERDLGEEPFHHWDQLYLKRIRYADYTEQDETKFLVSISFEYENRPDPFSEHRAGFEIRTRKRCKRIEVRTHAGEDLLIRTYEMVYLDQRPGMEHLLPRNGVSFLSQMRVVGHDQERTEELPPLEFGYAQFEPERREFIPLRGADLPARSLANPDTELVDLFGNGLPDILEMNGTVRYWRNLGDGNYDLPREMHQAPAGLQLADPGVQLIDANGDGRTDLLVTANGLSGYYPLRFGGLWDKRSFQRFEVAPSFNLEDPEVKLLDLDGDGVTDVLRSGSRFECFFNEVNGRRRGWTTENTRWVERRAVEDFPNVRFSDPRVKWADMTGDGLQDIVLVHDGNVEYWPNLGRGEWGRRVSMRSCPRLPYGHDPRRVLIGDVDGDGAADIVYVDDGRVTLWINRCGNGFSDPIEIRGTPSVSDMDAVRLSDVFGTGVGGVLWSADASGLSRRNMFFLDLTGGTKPYLLDEMDNHMGAVTKVAYAPSTRFYLEDQERPDTRWKTPLPFPVQVVIRVEVIDEISRGKLATEYRYHHGYWDGAEREFRGFGMVEQLDTESFEDYNEPGTHGEGTTFARVADRTSFSPPMLTKTWFHQGPIGDEFGEWEETDFGAEFWPDDSSVFSRSSSTTEFLKRLPRRAKRDALRTLRGRVLRTELYALDGTEREDRPYTVEEHLYGICEVVDEGSRHALIYEPRPGDSPAITGNDLPPRVFFPHTLANRTTQWERGNDPMTQFSFVGYYDAYGQPRRETQIACPRGWRKPEDTPGKDYLATRTDTVYARSDDSLVYIADRVAKTTTYEISNEGTQSVFDLKDTPDDSTTLRVIGQTLNFYDGDAFGGLPFGRLGVYGALVRTENLVFTEEILHEAYKSGSTVLTPPETPPYLVPGGSPAWTAEHPQEFRDRLPTLAGYTYRPGGAEYQQGYFASTERRRYDFHEDPEGTGRGLIRVNRDPLGRDTTIAYDELYELQPKEVTDPVGLKTTAEYDYRVLQPGEVIDPNGNRTRFTFTPLGLLQDTWVLSKPTNNEGDEQRPSVRMEYDFLAFIERGQPISVRSIRQIHHDTEADVPLPQRDQTIATVQYSDGFGRLLQTRTQAEDMVFGDPAFGHQVLPSDQSQPGGDIVGSVVTDPVSKPRVVVSGWQTYDNKGRVLEKYEPFFSEGWEYKPPRDAQLGQKATMFYDSRGQVVRTVNPDGSEQRVIYGVPTIDFSNPDHDPTKFTPTPWETHTYDANDNAGRTHPVASTGYQNHRNTPTSAVLDALGRTVETVERNGPTNAATDWYKTRSTYDIRGNLITVTDPLGRIAFRHLYDLANRVLRREQLDAGLRRLVIDAAGNTLEQRDSKGALALHAYDAANRPVRLWARDGTDQALTLRESLIYGDNEGIGLTAEQAAAKNLLGKPYKHYDEAGLLSFESYDFKGNLLEKSRQAIGNAAILAVFTPPNWQVKAFRVAWQPPPGTTLEAHAARLLDPMVYRTSLAHDALNRLKTMRYPQDVSGVRKELRPRYNRAGTLESVELDGKTYVERIAYNAKGQRTLAAYGNGVMSRHAYDPKTFHLVRMRTERYGKPNALTYHPTGALLQDFSYAYDLAGNLLALRDRTPGSGLSTKPNALDRSFAYDPLYRLLSATGRECAAPPPVPWNVGPRCADITKTRAYNQTYQYDPAGNLKRLGHQAATGAFTRVIALIPNSNRLATMSVGAKSYAYVYDASGNLLRENSSHHFEWDHADRMRVYRTQIGDSEPSVHAHYLYDSGGQRVKKLVRKQGGQVEVTVYVDGVFEHQRVIATGTTQENNTLHVMDNQSRIAQVRIGKPFSDDTTPAVKYHLGDHLGSSNVAIDETGSWVNREEYTPYGETSFGSFARKRYRFTGKERDEESGLSYHGARYYAPWLCRWTSCDPAGTVDSLNLYAYARNNSMRFVDHTGTMSKEEAAQYIERMYARNPQLRLHSQLVELYHGPNPKSSTGISLVIENQPAKEKIVRSGETIKDAQFAAMLSISAFGGGVAVEMFPILAYVLGPLGAFESGTSATQAVTGRHWLTGERLGTRERWESGVSGGLGLVLLFSAAASQRSAPHPVLGKGSATQSQVGTHLREFPIRPELAVEAPWVGKGSAGRPARSSTLGHERGVLFPALRQRFPNLFPGGPNNPRVTPELAERFPEFEPYIGEMLIEHHVGHGYLTYPVPKTLHAGKGSSGYYHGTAKNVGAAADQRMSQVPSRPGDQL
jgi:RHS repeat-associated protein